MPASLFSRQNWFTMPGIAFSEKRGRWGRAVRHAHTYFAREGVRNYITHGRHLGYTVHGLSGQVDDFLVEKIFSCSSDSKRILLLLSLSLCTCFLTAFLGAGGGYTMRPATPTPSTVPLDTRCSSGPGKITTEVNGLVFRSNFDSGNLARVVLPAEHGGAGEVYQLWTARDCEGGPYAKRNSSWFYFGVAGGSANQIITMRIMNLNNQHALYKHGMTPVFRLTGNPTWARLKQKVSFEEDGRHLQLQFQFRFTRDPEEVFFAFCFPYSYDDCNKDLDRFEHQARKDGMAVQALSTPQPGPTAYFHRELLIRTPEGRRVDLLTVTDCHGILDEREPQIDPHLFPEQEAPLSHRPFEFEGKDVVFVSSRVHPGETPASFVFQGILKFLLDPGDRRAAELRRRFVFKLVPLLNPDGIVAGHFRQDSYGNNLNRHYIDPDAEKHSSVYAAKAVVMHHAQRPAGRGRLTVYLDLHAHASARGCFIYGNHLPNLEDQAENQLLPLLMTHNTPHFDLASCNFTLKHMSRVDSGDSGLSAEGTGRVFYGSRAGVLRSYTLECNYNTGKAMCNHIPPADAAPGGERFASPERKATTPPRYHPEVWRDVGAGFLKALLDAEGASVWSRLPNSKFRTLERAKRHLVNELRSQPSYREQSLRLRRGASTGAATTTAITAASSALPLPPPPHGEARASPSSPARRSNVDRMTARNAVPSPLSRKTPDFGKAPAATVTADLAGSGGGGGTPALSGRATNDEILPGSRAPAPLLPTRPGKSPESRKFPIVRSRSGGSVRRSGGPSTGAGGRSGSGRGVWSSSSSRSDSGRRSRTENSGSSRSSGGPSRGRNSCCSEAREPSAGQRRSTGRSRSIRVSSATKDTGAVSSSGRGGARGGAAGGSGGSGKTAPRSSSRLDARRRSSGASHRDRSATPARSIRTRK